MFRRLMMVRGDDSASAAGKSGREQVRVMHKIDRKTLEAELAVRLGRAIKANKRALGSRRALESDAAIDAVVAELLAMVDNDHSCVVRTEMIHARMGPGKFGQDEPWPGEDRAAPGHRAQSSRPETISNN